MSQDVKKYLTCSQIAKALGVSRQAVFQWTKSGKLGFIKPNRSLLIPREEFDRITTLKRKGG